MKKMLFALILLPSLSNASIYNCNGSGFAIEVTANPLEMKIIGNNINAMAQNVRMSLRFDTVVSGNLSSPEATVKMTIKDSNFGSPGDIFKATLDFFSITGSKNITGINCIRGND